MKRRVLITGTSRGIGRALSLYFGAEGAEVLLLSRPSDDQTRTEQLLREQESVFESYECHLGERSSVDAALESLLSKGPPDVIIHNAGIIERAAAQQVGDDSWDRQIEVNLTAPMRITRSVLPAMLKKGTGRILFVSSISAVLGSKTQGAYHASKAGLLGYMRCLAEELSDTGLMTMALLPGSVDTDMLKGSPFPPRMSPQDIAKTLAFYATEAPLASNGATVESFGI